MKPFVRVFGALALFIGVAGLLFTVWLTLRDPFSGERFDSQVWKSFKNSYDRNNLRGPMVQDLMVNHLAQGMDHGSVEMVLGKADMELNQTCEGYLLGVWSGIRFFDYDVLKICYSSSNKLISVIHYQQ
jgi:hypothetical protein